MAATGGARVKTRRVRQGVERCFPGPPVVTYANSKRVPNFRQFKKNILGDPFVAEFSHGLGGKQRFGFCRKPFGH